MSLQVVVRLLARSYGVIILLTTLCFIAWLLMVGPAGVRETISHERTIEIMVAVAWLLYVVSGALGSLILYRAKTQPSPWLPLSNQQLVVGTLVSLVLSITAMDSIDRFNGIRLQSIWDAITLVPLAVYLFASCAGALRLITHTSNSI